MLKEKMKKILYTAVLYAFIACNTSGDKSSGSDTTTSEVGGVENVNGNIPDTGTMGATPNSPSNQTTVDSTYADTAGKTRP